MVLSGRRRRHKSLPFSLVNSKTGMNTIYSNYPSWLIEEVVSSRPTDYERGNDKARDLISIPGPGNWPDPGLWAGQERVSRGVTIPQMPRTSQTPSAGSSKWKKVIEQLGQMTGPEPDWDLASYSGGVTSPWSPTNTPYNPTYLGQSSAVAGLMGFDSKKKKQGYV